MMSIQSTGKLIRQHLLSALIFAPVILGALAIASVATPLGEVQSLQWNGASSRFDITLKSSTIPATTARIIYYRSDIFRIWVGPSGNYSDGAQNDCVVYSTPLSTSPTLTDLTDYFKIETSECVLRVYKAPNCRFALYRKDNTTVVFEESLPIDITAAQTTQTLKSQAGDYFYGCGGWNGHFCLNGLVAPAQYTGMDYYEGKNPNPTPYYCNLKGYGAYRNTWQPGTYTFQNPVKTIHNEGRFDCYYFYGPSLKKVLDGYTLITGRPFMPPIWGHDFGIEGDFTGGLHGDMKQATDDWQAHDFPTGWNVPNDYFSSPYAPVEPLVPYYKTLNMWTNLWCGKWMADTSLRIKMIRDWGIRFMKMDCEWIGAGYKKCMDAMKMIGPKGLELYSPDSARCFLQFTAGWAGQQRFGWPWTGDNHMADGNWTRWHIPTLTGSSMSALNGMSVELASIFGIKNDRLYVRAVQWQMMLPFVHLNGFWMSGGLPKYPWIQAPNYEALCRKLFKLHTRLIPYFYTLCAESNRTGVAAQRACVLEFPDDPNTWAEGTSADTKTKQEFMLGPWMLFRPVHEDLTTTTNVPMYLPGSPDTRWIDYWTGAVQTGAKSISAYAGGFSTSGQNIVMPTYILEGAIIPMFPAQYYSGKVLNRPREPFTLDVYPHRTKTTSFALYEDDGLTREYKQDKNAFTLIESDASKWLTDKELVLKIGAAVGTYTGKPAAKIYFASIHSGILDKNRPSSVYIDGLPTDEKASYAACSTSTSGWFYDAADRGGILWVKTQALSASAGHIISTGVPVVGIAYDATKRNMLNDWSIVATKQKITVTFSNMFNGTMPVYLYDIQGRLVLRKTLKVVNSVAEVLNGRNGANQAVTSGNYVLRLEYAGKCVTKNFVLQR